jgi:hypothetical protein
MTRLGRTMTQILPYPIPTSSSPGSIVTGSETFLSSEEAPLPQDGDIVITRDPTFAFEWTVRQVPGPAQFGTSSLGPSMQLARGYAQAHMVDLWSSDEGSYCVLARYRPRAGRGVLRH